MKAYISKHKGDMLFILCHTDHEVSVGNCHAL